MSLPVFAAVSAGLAEEFPEEEVLQHHEVDEDDWDVARVAWTRRLVEEGHEGPLFSQYQRALHQREDELGRSVEPIGRTASWPF